MIDMFMKNTHLPIDPTHDLSIEEIDNVLEFPNYEWDLSVTTGTGLTDEVKSETEKEAA